jgi:hypothetical protein
MTVEPTAEMTVEPTAAGAAVEPETVSRARELYATARARLGPFIPAIRIVGFAAAVAIVVYVGIRAAQDVHPSDLTFWPLPFAVVGAAVWWLLQARGWSILMRDRLTRHDVSVWCRTQALRFVPGGFWAPASRTTVVRGGPLEKLSTVGAENLVALCAAIALGGGLLAASGRLWWLPLVLLLAVPFLALRLVVDRTRLTRERILRLTANDLVAFAAYGVAAVLVQSAVSGFEDPFGVAGAASLSWAAGLVVVIAPSGVGVRELVYVWLLSSSLPTGELAAGAVAMRLVMIIAEFGVLLAAGRPVAPAPDVRIEPGAPTG